jgi:hypothetical protein
VIDECPEIPVTTNGKKSVVPEHLLKIVC